MKVNGDKVEIEFDAVQPNGTINFKGVLDKDELEFVLQFGLVTLLAQGSRVKSIEVEYTPHSPVTERTVN